MLKWFRIIMGILLAIVSILWAMIICGDRGWGIFICIPIAVGIFILLYGFFWLCMFTAEKITNAFAKVYHEKVVPRTQQAAIDKYKEDNLPVLIIIPDEKVNMEEPKIPKHQERLAKFMEKCEKERNAFIAKKEEVKNGSKTQSQQPLQGTSGTPEVATILKLTSISFIKLINNVV